MNSRRPAESGEKATKKAATALSLNTKKRGEVNIIMIISSLFLFGSAPSLRAGPRCFREAASQKVYPLLLRFNNSNYGRPKNFIFILFRPPDDGDDDDVVAKQRGNTKTRNL